VTISYARHSGNAAEAPVRNCAFGQESAEAPATGPASTPTTATATTHTNARIIDTLLD
jgi:hypothetical protein